jgi:hypothetical protein
MTEPVSFSGSYTENPIVILPDLIYPDIFKEGGAWRYRIGTPSEIKSVDPYDSEYKGDFKDKIILDVGADFGTTAHYFLSKGAKKVICVESLKECYDGLVINSKILNIHPVLLNILSSADWEKILSEYDFDIVKSDCEGGEAYLINVNDFLIKKAGEWIIEVHPWVDRENLKEKFIKNGFKLEYEESWRGNIQIKFMKFVQ